MHRPSGWLSATTLDFYLKPQERQVRGHLHFLQEGQSQINAALRFLSLKRYAPPLSDSGGGFAV